MPAIKKVSFTQVFTQLNTESYRNHENNDCAVKAVAVVAGVSYEAAKAELAKRGRKDRKGAYTHDILFAVRFFGKTVEAVDMRTVIARYPSPHRDVLKGVTTHHPRRFAKVWPKGKFLLFITRHVAACVDGELHDWTVNSAKRVQYMYEVK